MHSQLTPLRRSADPQVATNLVACSCPALNNAIRICRVKPANVISAVGFQRVLIGAKRGERHKSTLLTTAGDMELTVEERAITEIPAFAVISQGLSQQDFE